MAETEKLATLISSGSPVVSMFIPASVFVSAEVRTAKLHRSRLVNSATAISAWNYGVSMLFYILMISAYCRDR